MGELLISAFILLFLSHQSQDLDTLFYFVSIFVSGSIPIYFVQFKVAFHKCYPKYSPFKIFRRWSLVERQQWWEWSGPSQLYRLFSFLYQVGNFSSFQYQVGKFSSFLYQVGNFFSFLYQVRQVTSPPFCTRQVTSPEKGPGSSLRHVSEQGSGSSLRHVSEQGFGSSLRLVAKKTVQILIYVLNLNLCSVQTIPQAIMK